MYTYNAEQFRNTNPEILSRIGCSICNLIPIPLIRDKLKMEKIYCSKCAFTKNITRGRLTIEDKSLLEKLVIECKRFCGATFTYDTIDEMLEHEEECNYKIYETDVENFMNDNFQFFKIHKDEKLKNLEIDFEKMKIQFSEIYDIFNGLNLKVKTEQSHSTDDGNGKNETPNKLNFNNLNDIELEKKINLIFDKNFQQIKANFDNEIRLLNSKLSEIEKSFSDSQSLVESISKEINEKVNDCVKKTEFSEFKKDVEEKLLVDFENIKKDIKSGFKFYKSQSLSRFDLNKLKSFKSNDVIIKSDSFSDISSKIEELQNINDPVAFQNLYQSVSLNFENYSNNKILCGNITKVIKNTHSSQINCLVVKNKVNHIITCSSDNSIKIRNFKTNTLFKEIENAHNGKNIYTLLLTKENILISGGGDNNIRFWDDNYNHLYLIENNGNFAIHMVQSKNILIVADRDNCVKFYEITSRNLVNEIQTGHDEMISKILLLRTNDDILLTGSNDKTIKVWDIENYAVKGKIPYNKCKYSIEVHREQISNLIQLKFDDNIIISTDESGCIIFHSITNAIDHKVINKFELSFYDDKPFSDSNDTFIYELFKHRMLVSITNNSSILFWNLNNYEIMRKVKIDDWIFNLTGVDDDDGIVFTKGNFNPEIIIWN